MCFNIDENDKNEKIATENIHCYKILEYSKEYNFVGYFKIDYIYFADSTLDKTVLHESELFIDDGSDTCISIGLHSCILTPNIKTQMSIDCPGYVVEAYIPKGAKYYMNADTNEYVSNKLVVYTAKNKRKLVCRKRDF